MLRKMLLIASAIAIPLGATAVTTGITAVAESGTAGATALAITCKSTSGGVTFATPGVSQNGSFSSSPTSTTKTSTANFNCGAPGTGKSKGMSLVSNSTQCTGTNTPVTGCTAGQYNYDSASGFASSGATLAAEIPTLKIVIGTTTYISKTSTSAVTLCSGGEAGFNIKGKLTSPAAHAGEATKLTVCLGADTGLNTTGSFTNDYGAISTNGAVIATAAFASDTKLKIS